MLICIFFNLNTYIHTYIHKHTNMQTYKQRDIQTYRQYMLYMLIYLYLIYSCHCVLNLLLGLWHWLVHLPRLRPPLSLSCIFLLMVPTCSKDGISWIMRMFSSLFFLDIKQHGWRCRSGMRKQFHESNPENR